MPTKKTRINLTVEDDMNELLEELAILTGTPKTRLVMDFMNEIKPALVDMRDGLKLAKSTRQGLPVFLTDMVARANMGVAEMNKDFAEYLQNQQDNKND